MQSKFGQFVTEAVRPRDPEGTYKSNISYQDMQTIISKIEKCPAPFLKQALAEYLSENEHADWDGFDRRDLAPIKRMLEDFVLFFENYE